MSASGRLCGTAWKDLWRCHRDLCRACAVNESKNFCAPCSKTRQRNVLAKHSELNSDPKWNQFTKSQKRLKAKNEKEFMSNMSKEFAMQISVLINFV